MELKLTHWEMTGAPWCAASCEGKGFIAALHELITNYRNWLIGNTST